MGSVAMILICVGSFSENTNGTRYFLPSLFNEAARKGHWPFASVSIVNFMVSLRAVQMLLEGFRFVVLPDE